MCLRYSFLCFVVLLASGSLKAADTLDFESIYKSIHDFRIETTEIIEEAVYSGNLNVYEDKECTNPIPLDSLSPKIKAWDSKGYTPDFSEELNVYSQKGFDMNGRVVTRFHSLGLGFRITLESGIDFSNIDLLFVRWLDLKSYLDSSTFKVLNAFSLQALQIQDYSMYNERGSDRLDGTFVGSVVSIKSIVHNIHWDVKMDTALTDYSIGTWSLAFLVLASTEKEAINYVSSNEDSFRLHVHFEDGLEPYLCSFSTFNLNEKISPSDTLIEMIINGHFTIYSFDYMIFENDVLSAVIQKRRNTSMMSASVQSFISVLRALELTTYKYIVNSHY
ncbi:hypothetical protein GYB29_05355 [bacterium]|nr:hypothetical protein [bacterium]